MRSTALAPLGGAVAAGIVVVVGAPESMATASGNADAGVGSALEEQPLTAPRLVKTARILS